MFERFTKEARIAVVVAQEEARLLNHPRIGAEHLLLAITTRTGAPGTGTLARLGITPDACRAAVRTPDSLDEEDAEALRHLGIDLDAVRASAETAFGPGALDRPPSAPPRGWLRRGSTSKPQKPHIPFNTSAKQALERSLREALERKDNRIGTEHVLLGITALDDLSTAGLLRSLGTTPRDLRAGVLEDLRAVA
ncbi:Clp protease N-terminal domain-containing protein [Streptomyces luteireticuli]|uniref:Clp protease N-terminal domain-containing protein n=1 Tax=Streptomyces luteireticuli TaxID=173858 RepID=A0ABN0YDD8_9ACTN